MNNGELWRIEESSGIQTARRNEVAPLRATVADVDANRRCAETAIARGDAAGRRCEALT